MISLFKQKYNYSGLLLIFFLLFQLVACHDEPAHKEQTAATPHADSTAVLWHQPEPPVSQVPQVINLNVIAEQDPMGIYWGLRDTVSGKLVKDYSFQQIWDFKEGFAVMMLNNKFGLINRNGRVIVEPIYDALRSEMNCGHIVFENGYGSQVIYDTAGKAVLPVLSGVNVILPCQQRITLSGRLFGMINFKGDTILPFEFTSAFVVPEGFCVAEKMEQQDKRRWVGLYDHQGKAVLPHVYESIDAFVNGRAIFKRNFEWGVLDEQGRELVPPRYNRIDRYNQNGYAVVYKNYSDNNIRVGIINKKGHEVVSPKYQWLDQVYNVYDGMVALAENWLYGFADTTGKIVVPFKYVKVESFEHGLAKVWKDWRHCGYINKKGEEIIPCIFDPMEQANLRRYYNQFIIGQKDSVYYVFDYDGKQLTKLTYSGLGTLDEHKKSFVVMRGNQAGSMDSNFHVSIPINYESIEIINYNIVARKNGKFGFIAEDGRVLHPFKYDRIELVDMPYTDGSKNGLMKVGIGAKVGLMNASRHLVIPIVYEEIDNFSYGLAVVKRHHKYGYVDLQGREVIKAIYDEAKAFDGQTAEVTLKEETFFIDGKGQRVEDEED